MLAPSSNTVLEPETVKLLPADGSVTAHISRLRVVQISDDATSLQQFEVDTGRLADLPRRDVIAIVTHQPARRRQHRNRGSLDLVGSNALLEEPLDQLGALGTCAALQTVEQLADDWVGIVVHVANV